MSTAEETKIQTKKRYREETLARQKDSRERERKRERESLYADSEWKLLYDHLV